MSAREEAPREHDDALAIGIDIGGTKMAAGLVDGAGTVVERAARPTPGRTAPAAVVEDVIADLTAELVAAAVARGAAVVGVGLGAAGFVSADGERVVFAPHLSWRDEPVRRQVAERVGLPVALDNDANAAAWAEHRFGHGRGEPRLLLVTLGTGIGGAVVQDGVLERGRHGMAGEFGHMQVVPDGHPCECGNRGCWEQYASSAALRRAGRPDGIEVAAAARAGDPHSLRLLAGVGRWLGIGLANLVAAFDPGTVVVGGGLSQVGDLLLSPARAAFEGRLTGRGYRPVAAIRPALLGADAGLIGAADLARRQGG